MLALDLNMNCGVGVATLELVILVVPNEMRQWVHRPACNNENDHNE